jgi:hypothetical protein
MRIILDAAEIRELIDQNPIRHIQRMKDNHRPRGVLTPEEINMLFPSDWEVFEKVWVIPRYGIMCALAVSGVTHCARFMHLIFQFSDLYLKMPIGIVSG